MFEFSIVDILYVWILTLLKQLPTIGIKLISSNSYILNLIIKNWIKLKNFNFIFFYLSIFFNRKHDCRFLHY